jgi:hypothetical protein
VARCSRRRADRFADFLRRLAISQIVEESTRHEKDDEADEFKDTMKRKVGKDREHPFAIDFFIIKQQYNGDA